MAHYDCTNCGSTEGIAFGLCSSCTPAEYFEVQKQIKNICYQAEQEWNKHISLVKQQFFDDFYEKNGLSELNIKLKSIKPLK